MHFVLGCIQNRNANTLATRRDRYFAQRDAKGLAISPAGYPTGAALLFDRALVVKYSDDDAPLRDEAPFLL